MSCVSLINAIWESFEPKELKHSSDLVISTAAASEVHAVADCLRLQELGDVQDGGEADGRQDVVIQGPPPGRGQHPASTSVLSSDSNSSCGSVSQLVLVLCLYLFD